VVFLIVPGSDIQSTDKYITSHSYEPWEISALGFFLYGILRSGSEAWSAATEEETLFISLKFITFYQSSLGTKDCFGRHKYFFLAHMWIHFPHNGIMWKEPEYQTFWRYLLSPSSRQNDYQWFLLILTQKVYRLVSTAPMIQW
jgi:hypothetical protein